ncbi:MAG: hypothetical protein PHQ34_12595 [Methanothrix sp.]|nr:hypothetical protein [Methanothrix sp.]
MPTSGFPTQKPDRINSLVNIDPERFGARLGVLEKEGYVTNQSEMESECCCLSNGISASGLKSWAADFDRTEMVKTILPSRRRIA